MKLLNKSQRIFQVPGAEIAPGKSAEIDAKIAEKLAVRYPTELELIGVPRDQAVIPPPEIEEEVKPTGRGGRRRNS